MAVTLEEFKADIIKMNGYGRTGVEIAEHFLNRKANRQKVLEAFRSLGYATKAIGARIYISDAPWPTDKKLPESNKEFRASGLSSILW